MELEVGDLVWEIKRLPQYPFQVQFIIGTDHKAFDNLGQSWLTQLPYAPLVRVSYRLHLYSCLSERQ